MSDKLHLPVFLPPEVAAGTHWLEVWVDYRSILALPRLSRIPLTAQTVRLPTQCPSKSQQMS